VRIVFASWQRLARVVGLSLSTAAACTPQVATDPVPASMPFEPTASPPRVPEPTHVLVSPTTRRLDFSLGGIVVPADCTMAKPMPQAQCEFYHYLEGLDGYPTVTPARTPAPGPIDPATLTPQNVVVVDATTDQVFGDVTLGFDAAAGYLTITPRTRWEIGHLYLAGVRGYARGVTTGGREVVASVPYYLLKQDTSLTCGAAAPEAISDTCPPFALLAGQMSPAAARATTAQLEALRLSYNQLHTTELLAQPGGIPRSELAVYWAFPVHTSPVVEVNPPTGLVPSFPDDHTVSVAVNGALDPAKLVPTTAGSPGSVTLLDLTAVMASDLIAGLPSFAVTFQAPSLRLQTRDPLVRGHQYGLFLGSGITSPDGKPLVPSPVSFLLTAHGPLVSGGKSQVGGVSDADAAMLEAGRVALGQLFDNVAVQAITGLDRAKLAYVYAFPYGGP
jgi:hypothetical protein